MNEEKLFSYKKKLNGENSNFPGDSILCYDDKKGNINENKNE